MAIYSRRRRRATAKRKAPSGGTRTEKIEAERKAAKRRAPAKKRGAAKAVKRARKKVARPAVKKRAGKPAPLPKRKAAKKPTPAPKRKKPAPAPKRKAAKKSTPAPKARARKPTKKKKLSKRELARRRTARTHAEVARVRKLEQKARGKPKKSPPKKKARAKRKETEVRRTQRALVTQDLPRDTKPKRRKSAETSWERMRRRFRERFNYASKTKQLPGVPRIPRKMPPSRYLAGGDQRTVRIRRIISPESVEDILYTIDQVGRSMGGTYFIWLGTLVISSFGERLVGYGHRMLEIRPEDEEHDQDQVDAGAFTTQAFESTGVYSTYQGLIDTIRTMLEGYASALHTVIYLHYVRLMNFDRRSGS